MPPTSARGRRRVRVHLPALAALALVSIAALLVSALRPSSPLRRPAGDSTVATAALHANTALLQVPRPVAPAFVPGEPVYLRPTRYVSRWAVVRTPTWARAAPSTDSRPLARVTTRTPEGTSNIVLVLDDRVDAAGDLWIRVRLPITGPENTGWVRREALGGYGTVRTRLVVDLRALEARLFRDGQEIFRASIGAGKPAWPTPTGEYYIRNRLTEYASPTYGPVAFGTSARSEVLTDWPAGAFVGIHGTDRPDLLPGYVSHGCIRMPNADIAQLARLMPVGTPLTIQ